MGPITKWPILTWVPINFDINTINQTLPGMKSLMSWIPALFGFAGAALICLYPLNDEKQKEVTQALLSRRSEQSPISA